MKNINNETFPSVSRFTKGTLTKEEQLNDVSLSELNVIRSYVNIYKLDLKIQIKEMLNRNMSHKEILSNILKKLG